MREITVRDLVILLLGGFSDSRLDPCTLYMKATCHLILYSKPGYLYSTPGSQTLCIASSSFLGWDIVQDRL